MAAIDKLFCNTLFEQKFPLAFVIAKTRAGGDHVPLILDFGCMRLRNLVSLDLKNNGLSN